MTSEYDGHQRRSNGDDECAAGPARRKVEHGRGWAAVRGCRGLAAPLLALVAAAGVVCAAAAGPPVQFVDSVVTVFNANNVRRNALGTPLDGSNMRLPCGLDFDGESVCSMDLSWGELKCKKNAICFLVAVNGATNMNYEPSPNLLRKINDASVVTTTAVLSQPATADQVEMVQVFTLEVKDASQLFPNADDLSVCFEASATGVASARRCVNFYLASLPVKMLVASNHGDPTQGGYTAGVFTDQPISIPAWSFESFSLTVRTHDWNMRDEVSIIYAGTNGLVSMDQELDQGVLLWSDMPYAECVGGLGGSTGQECLSRTWERKFFAKPKNPKAGSSYFIEFTATSRPRGWNGYVPDVLRAGDAKARVNLRVTDSGPRFMDHMYNLESEGTPLEGEVLPPVAVNCHVHAHDADLEVALYASWPDAVGGIDGFNVTYLANHANAPPGLRVLGVKDVSVDWALYPPPLEDKTGNRGFRGEVKEIKFAWTPRHGAEGRTFDACFSITNATLARGNMSIPVVERTRCFKLEVARCMYCSEDGDTLQSIATKFGTNWQQLWTANAGPVSPYDPPGRYPLEPAVLPTGTRLSLGPLYYTKTLDSLDSLSTRCSSRPWMPTPAPSARRAAR